MRIFVHVLLCTLTLCAASTNLRCSVAFAAAIRIGRTRDVRVLSPFHTAAKVCSLTSCRRMARAPTVAAAAAAYSDKDLSTMRNEYTRKGWVAIPNFVTATSCADLLGEATKLLESDAAFYSTDAHTVYQESGDATFGGDHARNTLQQSSKRIIDYARLGAESPLRQLYVKPALLSLVQQIVSPTRRLHLSECPFNAAYYNMYRAGDGLGWHFDKGEFGVNLILQTPSGGGDFEYHHNTRTPPDNWAFDTVDSILAGNRAGVVSAEGHVGAGSLVIFNGRQSLHRVSPVEGAIPRINAILVYEGAPGQRLGEYPLRKFFGRHPEGE